MTMVYFYAIYNVIGVLLRPEQSAFNIFIKLAIKWSNNGQKGRIRHVLHLKSKNP